VTSPGSGKRPTKYFEKIGFPPTMTSKTPLPPTVSLGFSPVDFSISAATRAASGK
jgi:hypothetical protein